MSALERNPEDPGSAPDEDLGPSTAWKGILRFQPQLQMRTATPAVTGEKSQEAPSNSHGDWTFLRPHERVPEVPVVTREKP